MTSSLKRKVTDIQNQIIRTGAADMHLPAQDRFLFWEASDVTQEVNGKQIMFDRNMGDSEVCKITVHIKGANFAASAVSVDTNF